MDPRFQEVKVEPKMAPALQVRLESWALAVLEEPAHCMAVAVAVADTSAAVEGVRIRIPVAQMRAVAVAARHTQTNLL